MKADSILSSKCNISDAMVQPMDINDVLEVVADFGRLQWVYLLINGVVCTIFAFQMFLIVFSHGEPDFR